MYALPWRMPKFTPPPTPTTMGSRVRALRKAQGMTQREVAFKAGISQPSYSVLESGETKVEEVKATTIVMLAKALKTNPDYLLGLTPSPVAGAALTLEQSELLTLFSAMPQEMQTSWLSSFRTLVGALSNGKASPVDPYPGKPKP